MELNPSPSESRRFGLAVARMTMAPDEFDRARSAIEASDADVVIVRSPASAVQLPALLETVPGYESFHADTLMYWSWGGGELRHDDAPSPLVARDVDGRAEIEHVVRGVFDGYANHYAANPLFDPAAALAGYCEWGAGLVEAGDATCTVLDGPDGEAAGFGIVDWATDPSDVRLAGMMPAARGRGWYRWVVAQLMHEAEARGRTPLWISTQAYNVTVMRTWARLGWLPSHSIVTTHLVRAGRLAARGRRAIRT